MNLPLSSTRPNSQRLADRLQALVRGRLWLQVLVAMALGVGVGIALGPTTGWVPAASATAIGQWLALPGHLFLALVQMIVIPLVVASIVMGMTSVPDARSLRSVGLRTMSFFVASTFVAGVVGVGAALLVQPGLHLHVQDLPVSASGAAGQGGVSIGSLPGHILSLIPTNPLQAGVEQNMLQVVVFAAIVGVALASMARAQAEPLLNLLGAVQELSMVVVRWAMALVPLAVFGLMAQVVARLGLDALLGVGVYVLTVIGGLLVLLALLLLTYVAVSGASATSFLRAARDVMLLAFSTSSSAAVMPVTMRTAEQQLGVRPAIARFVVPLGATVNMAGTCLYQIVATLFLAQAYRIDVSLSDVLLVVVMAVGASIGSPGTPGIGIVILALLLGALRIPAEGIAMIIGVDRLLDMCRTTVNVTGDLVAACVVDRWAGPAQDATADDQPEA